MATISANQQELIKLYVASFLRAPELGGFEYWSGQLASGKSLAQVGWTIFSLDIVKAIYPTTQTSAEFVGAIYQNVFGKTADADGLAYWRGLIDNDGITRGELVLRMINAGLNTPNGTPGKAYIVNRYNAALYAIDQQLNTTTELSPSFLRTQMDSIGEDVSTLTTYANAVRQNLQATGIRAINFSDAGFTESTANDGSIQGTLTLVIRGDTFKGDVGAALGTITRTPAGLTASIVKTSDLTAQMTLSGKATAHGTASSIGNLTVTFSAADFGSGDPTGLTALNRNDLKVTFYDTSLSESGGLITGVGEVAVALVVDLASDTITLAGANTTLRSGTIASATGVDASAMKVAVGGTKPATASVSLFGDSAANTLAASTYGGTINGRSGNDTLTAGIGIDRFVFGTDATTNGNDTITGFTLGAGGDVLAFASFLNKTGVANVAPRNAASTNTALANGDVVIYSGEVTSTEDVAALFNGAAFAAVTTAGKYVLITASVTGDASVWYIANQATPATIAASEVNKVATLVGVNNIELVPFVAANFA